MGAVWKRRGWERKGKGRLKERKVPIAARTESTPLTKESKSDLPVKDVTCLRTRRYANASARSIHVMKMPKKGKI